MKNEVKKQLKSIIDFFKITRQELTEKQKDYIVRCLEQCFLEGQAKELRNTMRLLKV